MKLLLASALLVTAIPAAAVTFNLGLSNGSTVFTSYDFAGNVIANNLASCGVDCVTNDDVPFWTATTTFSSIAAPYALDFTYIGADDTTVLLIDGSPTFLGAGLFGPGDGVFFFSPTAASTPFTFQGNGSTYSESGFLGAASFTFTWVVNNNDLGIFGTALTGGPSSLQISGTFTQVPEPASWALMIAGFGLVGVSMRRRKAAVAA